jgi:hypothetical protein
MAYKLSQVATGEVKRLMITVPPRNLKSICASVALPAWFLGHHPSERAVAISYSADLAKVHANDFRRVVSDPLYQTVFPDMRVARNTDQEITTTLRGKRYATSIEGTLTASAVICSLLTTQLSLETLFLRSFANALSIGTAKPC